MLRMCIAGLIAWAAFARGPVYELRGRIEPPTRAALSIYGANTPFSDTAESGDDGRFRFRNLVAGAYTLSIVVPGRGEARVTVEIDPGAADSARRVEVVLNLKDSDFTMADAARQRNAVSAAQLAIPAQAWREYEAARRELARRDAAAAQAHLEKAVSLAPPFEAAWNTLGTIFYQRRDYERAEQCFRKALRHDPKAYEALVNLGGVLINLHRLAEAADYNERAVSRRPNDALANAQLGMTYFELGHLEPAEKYLTRAVEIDPAHFSHPQLMLAEIHVRREEPRRAADDLESFLAYHPGWKGARKCGGRSSACEKSDDPAGFGITLVCYGGLLDT